MFKVKNKKKRIIFDKKIQNFRYGIIHSQFGFSDGVSIVMKQAEKVMRENLGIPFKNIFYLVGKSKEKSLHIVEKEILWDKHPVNKLMLSHFKEGYGGEISEKVEQTIHRAKNVIQDFVEKHKIDILFVHNSSHPVNFISSIALSRYYRDAIKNKKKTPKYILWWHDSHLERKQFRSPSKDVECYLLEGVPGRFVEHIIFINSLQFKTAKKYFLKIDERNKGFYRKIQKKYNIIRNTTDTYIRSYQDLNYGSLDRVNRFFEDFKIEKLLEKNNFKLSEVLFCLQHTRIVDRKRIDFALEFVHNLLYQLKKQKKFKAIYFLVSGQSADNSKTKLIKLNRKLSRKFSTKVFLNFAEDKKTKLSFEEYPIIFAKLKGFSTYFSEVEGYGNNLLEVLASGLLPVIYEYPVYKKDIEKYHFDVVKIEEYKIDEKLINKTIDFIINPKKREKMVEENLKILKKKFPNRIMAIKLLRAITKPRAHI